MQLHAPMGWSQQRFNTHGVTATVAQLLERNYLTLFIVVPSKE